MIQRNNGLYRAIAVLLICTVPAFAVGPGPSLPDPGSSPISKEEQIKVGQQAVQQVYKQMPILPDSDPVTKYIQQLGGKLTAVIPQEYSWPWQFHVVQQKDINAFAVPGGPLFINIGTITAADNEAELAGVMAHEISHVYMQHSAKQAGKSQMTQGLAGILGSVFGGGALGTIARAGAGLGAGLLTLKYSRGDEAQADAVGAVIMYKAGYNPQAMADFFQKLEQESGGSRGPQLLSDHPNPGNRREAIANEVKDWPHRNYQQTSSQFASAKQRAAGVKAYTGEEIAQRAKAGGGWNNQGGPQGGAAPAGSVTNVSRGQVMPSGGFQQLNGGIFSIEYPSNWQAAQAQDGSGAQIAPQAGVSQNGLAYGAVISVFQPQNAQTMDDAVRELVSSITQQNPGMQASGGASNVRVNGVSGKSLTLTGNSPVADSNGRPARERDWLVALPRQDGTILYTVFVAPDRDFGALKPTYERMLRSLKVQ